MWTPKNSSSALRSLYQKESRNVMFFLSHSYLTNTGMRIRAFSHLFLECLYSSEEFRLVLNISAQRRARDIDIVVPKP